MVTKRGRILGTVKRGRVKIRSKRQMRFLHNERIDHTHIDRKGRRRRHTY